MSYGLVDVYALVLDYKHLLGLESVFELALNLIPDIHNALRYTVEEDDAEFDEVDDYIYTNLVAHLNILGYKLGEDVDVNGDDDIYIRGSDYLFFHAEVYSPTHYFIIAVCDILKSLGIGNIDRVELINNNLLFRNSDEYSL